MRKAAAAATKSFRMHFSGMLAIGVIVCAVVFALDSLQSGATGGVNVTTYHNDNARTGQNLNEALLTPANVNQQNFGKLFSMAVDGYVYAQPLLVANVRIPGRGTHNLLLAATEHDSVYALDADGGRQLWHTSFIDPERGITTVSPEDVACEDLAPEIGITGTPVVDKALNRVYLVARTRENGVFYQRLHILSLTSGREISGSPVEIQGSAPGNGDGSVNGRISFDPLRENQRAGLLLQKGLVVITWASQCDASPYHGWLMAYDAQTGRQISIWISTPNAGFGGIWQSGAGIAADENGNAFFATGNAVFDADIGRNDYGNSILRLPLDGSYDLKVADYFTPFDQELLRSRDIDLGAGGVLLLPDQPGPHPHLLVEAGKGGAIYLVDRYNMGHYKPDGNKTVQFLNHAVGGVWGAPAWWNNSIYFGGSYDVIKQFAFNPASGLLSPAPVSTSPSFFGFPGPTVSVSANGASNGIAWAIETSDYRENGPAILHAYDATNLANELYNTNQNVERDNPGNAVKFAVPTIGNGKVYVGAQNEVSVYGLLE